MSAARAASGGPAGAAPSLAGLEGGSRRGLTLLQAQGYAGTLAVLCAFCAAAVSGDLGRPLVALFVAALIGAAFVGDRFAHRHDGVWTVLLLGALAVLFLQVFVTASLDIVLGAARFALLLTIHRLWNRQSERDELLLLLLSLLLLCAGAALSAELLFGFAFAAYGVTATWALALTHLRWQIEAGRGPQSPQALLRSRRLVTPALLGGLALLSLVGLIGATVLFFVFPRVTIGGLRRVTGGRSLAGLSETVDLSGHGTIADDPRVVLRVTFDPDPGAGVPQLGAHFRARALEVWTGRGWRARDASRTPVTWLPAAPKPLRAPGRWQVVDVEAVAGASDGIVLTPPGWPVSVRFHRPLSASGNPFQLFRDGAGDLFYTPLEVGDRRYFVTIEPLAEQPPKSTAPVDPAHLPAALAPDLELPPDLDPRVRALGEQLVRGKPAGAAADAVRGWLETNFQYTRELNGGAPDPIADFLFERKKGHCELFSSAMVLILRAGGVPARNVTGYYGGVRTSSGYYALRAGDAHSWVEAWLPGLGWFAYDPTPAEERGSRQDGLWAAAVLAWDGLAERWRSSVVDFDLLSQVQAAQRALEVFKEAGRKLSGKGSGGAPRVPWALLTAAALLTLAGALLVLRRRRRLLAPDGRTGLALPADAARARRLWQQARRRLAQAGLTLPPSATPREVARAADRVLPQAAPALHALVRRCLQARWGGTPLPQAEARRLLGALQRSL